jgi:Recombination endonuclease VII
MSTPERRRQRFAEDPEHRERLRVYKRANRQIHKEECNRRRRLRFATDPEYRAKRLASRPKNRRKADLKARYGMSLEQYALMRERQGGACAICGEQPVEALCVDHCHATDKVRGLLCRGCNFGLGHYRDDQRLTMAATAYLRRAALEDEAL